MGTPADNTTGRQDLRTRLGGYLPLLVVAACSLPGLRNVSDSPIANDPDTPAILEAIREDASPVGLLRWFARDWPLGNGFYRPVVAISLAGDSAIHGDDARGYRLTNWVLAVVCSLGAYWLFASLSGSPVFAGGAGAIFALRQSGCTVRLPIIVEILWAAAILVGLVCLYLLYGRESDANRQARSWLITGAAAFVLIEVDWRSNAVIVHWIAARTALLGALFSVFALGCFAKVVVTGRRGWTWPALVAACLALCSYEQSVMLPFAAAAILLWRRPRNRGAATVALALLGLALILYVAVRLWAVGDEITTYHLIQAKTSIRGPLRALADYAIPVMPWARSSWLRVATSGRSFFLDRVLWINFALIAAWLLAYVRLCRMAWRGALALWLVKALTFLPMAFLHFFPHYLYLPEVAGAALGMAALWPRGLMAPRREFRS